MDQALKTVLKNIELKSGKPPEYWIQLIKQSGFQKHGEKMKFLKEEHGFTHGYANTLVHLAKEDSAVNAANKEDLVLAQYAKKEALKPIYDKLLKEILKFGADVELAPKKAYVSIRRNKQFALIQPSTKTRIDIGLNVKGIEPDGLAKMAGSWNTMVTHRIQITDISQINKELINWLKKAYKNG